MAIPAKITPNCGLCQYWWRSKVLRNTGQVCVSRLCKVSIQEVTSTTKSCKKFVQSEYIWCIVKGSLIHHLVCRTRVRCYKNCIMLRIIKYEKYRKSKLIPRKSRKVEKPAKESTKRRLVK